MKACSDGQCSHSGLSAASGQCEEIYSKSQCTGGKTGSGTTSLLGGHSGCAWCESADSDHQVVQHSSICVSGSPALAVALLPVHWLSRALALAIFLSLALVLSVCRTCPRSVVSVLEARLRVCCRNAFTRVQFQS